MKIENETGSESLKEAITHNSEERLSQNMTRKAAIISLNKRVVLSEKNIRTLEAKYFREWLLAQGKYDQVDFVSSKSSRKEPTENVEYYKEASTTSLHEYDHVFLHNDTDNFFGGTIAKHTIKQIKELCTFSGPVFYLYTDPNLHLLNLARIILKRQQKGTKTVFKTDERLTEEEAIRFANISWRVIWCGSDFNSYRTSVYQHLKPELRCNIHQHKNTNFFGFLFKKRRVELPDLPLTARQFDLVYYGNWRPKRAIKINRYFNNTLRKRILGFDQTKVTIRNAEFHNYVEPERLAGMVQQAIASVVIGDPSHNNNITTARFYENILFDVCSFIDLEYDPNRKLYKSEFLKGFMYVSNGQELVRKVEQIRNDEGLFKKILSCQKEELS